MHLLLNTERISSQWDFLISSRLSWQKELCMKWLRHFSKCHTVTAAITAFAWSYQQWSAEFSEKKLSFLRWVVGKDDRGFSVPSNCCTQVKWLYETETLLEFKFAWRLLLKTIFGPNQQLDGSSSLCIVWQLVLTINEFCAGGFLHTDVKGVTDSGNQVQYFCAGTGSYNHLTNNFHN